MKILVTYTAPAVYFEEAVRTLKKKHEGCSVFALISQKAVNKIAHLSGIDGIIPFRGRFFNFFTFAFKGLWKVRELKFDEIVILYNNSSGKGYAHIELFGFFSGARKITTASTTFHHVELEFRKWLKNRGAALESYKIIDAASAFLLFLFWFAWVSARKIISNKKATAVPENDRKVIFICHFGYELPSARVRCYNFAEELKRHGINAEVYSFYDKQKMDFRVPGDLERILSNIKAFHHLARAKNAILYVQKGDYHFLTPLALRWLNGNKIIFDIDDWEYDVLSFHFIKCGWIKKYMAQKSDMCIVASSFLMKEYKEYSSNMHFLPTVVDHKQFFPMNGKVRNNSNVIFSWVGMIWGPPILENVLFLMECFSELSAKNIELEITGGGELMPYVKKHAELKHGNVPIKIRDWIHPTELPHYLNGIDVGLLPLITASKYNLAKSPTKLFEYMACAKPTISSRLGEAKEWIIQDGVNGFLAEGKEEFKEKIMILAQDPNTRTTMGEAARKSIEEKWSQEEIGKRLYGIIYSLNPKDTRRNNVL